MVLGFPELAASLPSSYPLGTPSLDVGYQTVDYYEGDYADSFYLLPLLLEAWTIPSTISARRLPDVL